MMFWFIDRLREASTWRGITLMLTAAGVTLSPEQASAIATAGIGLAGALGVFTRDKR